MRPLTCKALIDFLDDYVDGALPPEARTEFDTHLAQCPPCVDFLKSYRETIALARRACAETPEAGDAAETRDMPEEMVTAILNAVKRSG